MIARVAHNFGERGRRVDQIQIVWRLNLAGTALGLLRLVADRILLLKAACSVLRHGVGPLVERHGVGGELALLFSGRLLSFDAGVLGADRITLLNH